MIRFKCPSCAQKIKLREEDAGRAGDCPKCKGPLEAPKVEMPVPGAASVPEDFEAGDEVGEYLLEKMVGKGGFAQVWSARKDGGPAVAIKIPHDTGSVRELLNEGMQLRRLNHPNIVRTIDINLKALPPHIVLEYVDGVSLYTLAKRNRASGEYFSLSFIDRVFSQILDGVEHAHKQAPPVIHADLKPHNILVADQIARIVDFGLGREEQKLDRILSTSVAVKSRKKLLGTEAYMAPEQKKGESTDERTDIFALGLMLQEILCNEVYCGHTLPGEINPLAKPFDAVVKKATAAFPKWRFANISELRESFAGAMRVATGKWETPGVVAKTGTGSSAVLRAVGAAEASAAAARGVATGTETTGVVPRMLAADFAAPTNGGTTRVGMAVIHAAPDRRGDTENVAAPSPMPDEDAVATVEPLAALLRDPRVLWGAAAFVFVAFLILVSIW